MKGGYCSPPRATARAGAVATAIVLVALSGCVSERGPLPVAAVYAVSPPAARAAPDLVRLELDLRPDFARGELAERAILTFANPGLEASFTFGLRDSFTTVGVREASSPVAVERESGGITVRLERPAREVVLTFDLAGPAGASSDEKREVLSPDDLFLLWSDRFYPTVFDDWAVCDIALTLPPGFEAIAPGRLAERQEVEGAVRWRFTSEVPIRLPSVFADRRWQRREHRIGGLRIQTLFHPESAALADAVARTSADVLAFYTELHGSYVFDGFSFVTLDRIYARRAFPGFVGYSPAYLAREMERTGHDAHETALLWWFSTFSGRGPGSFQWTEGLGDYVEMLYDEARGKPIPGIFERFRAEYLAMPPGDEVPLAELRGSTPQRIVHGRYPWLMHLLRFAVGDAAFRQGVARLTERYRFGTFSLDELVATFAEASGRSLVWWRDEWLLRPGVPELALELATSPQANGHRVQITVRQLGVLYQLPLEIGLESAAGMRIERVELPAAAATTFTFDSAEPVARVVLDPRRWLLARLAAPVP